MDGWGQDDSSKRADTTTGVEPSLDETKTSTSQMLFVEPVPPVFSGICSRNWKNNWFDGSAEAYWRHCHE